MSEQFFNESLEQSQVKSVIVEKYFMTWAKVMISTMRRYPHREGTIAYVDLFAGRGRYDDGTISTPLMLLQKAIQDPDLCEKLQTIFNDADHTNTQILQTSIQALPNIDKLRYPPTIWNQEVGDKLVQAFAKVNLPPTLAFVDPWGYKGLSLQLVNAILKNWGCDCIFFFNYNRINMGLSNIAVRKHMEALFGAERASYLHEHLSTLNSEQRELTIVEELSQALKEMGGEYILPFCFRNARGSRTSHYLIFVSKHHVGYDKMKDIMAKESSCHEQGVPTFVYSPADERQPLLFEYSRPLDDLGPMLLTAFAGETLTTKAIYAAHNVGRRYILKNYKNVLAELEEQGLISVASPKGKKRGRKGSFADDLIVTFPPSA